MPFFDYSIHPFNQLDLDGERIEDLRGRIQHAIEQGPLPSVQVALARNGKLALFETFGAADNNTRYNVFSCSKPLVASAVWRLMGEGLIDIDRTVGHYIPDFADNGKQDVTVEQVLCHTSGFPRAPWERPSGGRGTGDCSGCAVGTSTGSPAVVWSTTRFLHIGCWRS